MATIRSKMGHLIECSGRLRPADEIYNANESGGSYLASRASREGSALGARDLGNGDALQLEMIASGQSGFHLIPVGPVLVKRMRRHQHTRNMVHLMLISSKDT